MASEIRAPQDFAARCNDCGVVIPTATVGSEFREDERYIYWVVRLEKVDVELHHLTHTDPT